MLQSPQGHSGHALAPRPAPHLPALHRAGQEAAAPPGLTIRPANRATSHPVVVGSLVMQFDAEQLRWAVEVVGRWVPPTPQYAWPLLADIIGAEVWVKHENHTPTGAFKVRGGLVYAERMKA